MVLMCASVAVAQAQSTSTAKPQAMAAQGAPTPQPAHSGSTLAAHPQMPPPMPVLAPAVTPAPEMGKLFEKFIGKPEGMGMPFARFTTEESWEAGPMSPAVAARGLENMRPGPARLSIIFDYMQLRQPDAKVAPLNGHGIISWDPAAKRYEEAWTDNMNPGVQMATGNWEGDKLVLRGKTYADGKEVPSRETYSDFTDKGFTFTLESLDKAGKASKIGTIKYTKQPMMRMMPPTGAMRPGMAPGAPKEAPMAPKAPPAPTSSTPPPTGTKPPKK